MYKAFKQHDASFPVSDIVIRRSALDQDRHIQYHIDGDSSVMHVWLNDDADGGNLFYLDQNGMTKIEVTMGTGVFHSDNIVHGVSSFTGTRYILLFIGPTVNHDDVLADVINQEPLIHSEL